MNSLDQTDLLPESGKPWRQISWKGFLTFLLVFSPAWLLLVLIKENAVNIPVWDGWSRAYLFEKWEQGTLSFADLYAPHIDHRIAVPRLLSLAVAQFAQGDLRWEIAANWIFGFLAGLGIWKLALRTLGPQRWTPAVAFLANLWIFSPLQYDNWLWPIQTAFLLPMACMIWAIYISVLPWHWTKRCLLTSLLAIIGTHSFSHGLFIWPVVLLLVALQPGDFPSARGKWKFAALFTAIGALIVGCYFLIDYTVATDYSYNQPRGAAPPTAAHWSGALADQDRLLNFFFRFLGQPFVRQFAIDPLPLSRPAGLAALVAYLVAGIWAVWHRKSSDTWFRLLPWLALGGAVIAIAFVTSLGRITVLADARAVIARLLSVSLYLSIALLAIFLHASSKKGTPLSSASWFPRVSLVVLGGLIALQIQPWTYGKRLMEIWRYSRQQAQVRVMFMEHFEINPTNVVSYQLNSVTSGGPLYHRLGLLEHPFVDGLSLDQFSFNKRSLSPTMGLLALADETPKKSGPWKIRGHAVLRKPSRPADGVLITAESPDQKKPVIIGLAEFDGNLLPTRYRIDLQFSALQELHESDPGTWTRWKHEITTEQLPPDRPVTVRAWAFDVTRRKAYPTRERLLIKADGSTEIIADE